MSTTLQSLSPNLMVADVNNTIDFYRDGLGFKVIATVPEKGKFDWGMVQSGSVSFMFQEEANLKTEYPGLSNFSPGGGLTFYIRVTDVIAYFHEVKDKVKVIKEPHKTFYGATEFSILDNSGYILTFSQDIP